MAGHSHFKNIKRKKEAEDKKRAVLFSKMARLLISAVREKGDDPQSNPALRMAILRAKEADMPKENINRAIKRGMGVGEEGKLEPFLFEAYGPDQSAFLIQGSTDNRNRDLNEIKEILKKHGGKLVKPGAVKWLFQPQGIIETEKNEEMLTKAIEHNVEDVEEKNHSFFLYVSPQATENLKNVLGEKISSFTLGWRANDIIGPASKSDKKLFDDLDSLSSVEGVYLNTKI